MNILIWQKHMETESAKRRTTLVVLLQAFYCFFSGILRALFVCVIFGMLCQGCAFSQETEEASAAFGLKETEEETNIITLDRVGFQGLAWWSDFYDGSFPKECADYYSWGTDVFCDKVVHLIPVIEQSSEGQEIVVAVVDSGFNISKVDKERLWVNPFEDADDGLDNDSNGYVDDQFGITLQSESEFASDTGFVDSHGTGVLNILIGEHKDYRGILCDSNVKVMLIRILDIDERCSIDRLVEAIEYAEINGAAICNLSLTTGVYSEKLKDVMEQSEMLFVVPAGNEASELGEKGQYPAMFGLNNVITVAALRADGCLSKQSNYSGQYVDIAAPGADIVTMNGRGQLILRSGTSYAVPFVVASAVVWRMTCPEMSAEKTKEHIVANARSREPLEGVVRCGGIVSFIVSK